MSIVDARNSFIQNLSKIIYHLRHMQYEYTPNILKKYLLIIFACIKEKLSHGFQQKRANSTKCQQFNGSFKRELVLTLLKYDNL